MRSRLGLIAAVLGLLILIAIALFLMRGVTGLVKLYGHDESPQPDPMFAEPAEVVTRPPEPDADGVPVVSGDDDPSRNWVYETLTPVERTAGELAGEP
ncbi:MAG: hypothetical protein IJJ45_09860 [Clostridia bacterium]|nr:hypothetical protein [Clostridia bacterium]